MAWTSLFFFFLQGSLLVSVLKLFAECPNDDGRRENCCSDWTDSVTAVGESLDESVRQASYDVELIVERESGTHFFRRIRAWCCFPTRNSVHQ